MLRCPQAIGSVCPRALTHLATHWTEDLWELKGAGKTEGLVPSTPVSGRHLWSVVPQAGTGAMKPTGSHKSITEKWPADPWAL